VAHATIVGTVAAAVTCSVGAQYGIKLLVDALSRGAGGPTAAAYAWSAFIVLVALIAADNFLWRVASWIASSAFVGVTGDLRRDLFRHLTSHAPSYFADRMPGTLTSRITATSNAVFTLENMFVWNVMPPCAATVVAIIFIASVSLAMAGALTVLAGVLVIMLFRLAAAGRPLHHDFADKAAVVDGEMVDVISNISLVWSFCGLGREHGRIDGTISREMAARRRSLRYLEKLRLLHAGVTVVLTIALLAWALVLWQNGVGTSGDARPFYPARDPRFGSSPCGRDAACGAAFGGAFHPASSALAARPRAGKIAGASGYRRRFPERLVHLSGQPTSVHGLQLGC
jgi:ATP-binding cassette subfamily B protein